MNHEEYIELVGGPYCGRVVRVGVTQGYYADYQKRGNRLIYHRWDRIQLANGFEVMWHNCIIPQPLTPTK